MIELCYKLKNLINDEHFLTDKINKIFIFKLLLYLIFNQISMYQKQNFVR